MPEWSHHQLPIYEAWTRRHHLLVQCKYRLWRHNDLQDSVEPDWIQWDIRGPKGHSRKLHNLKNIVRIIGTVIYKCILFFVLFYCMVRYLCVLLWNWFNLLCPHVVPKYPSLHTQINVSTLTSMQVPLLSQGELLHASKGPRRKVLKRFSAKMYFWMVYSCNKSRGKLLPKKLYQLKENTHCIGMFLHSIHLCTCR